MLIFGDEQVGGLVKWYPATTISGRARNILDASGNPRRSAEGSFQAAVDRCSSRRAKLEIAELLLSLTAVLLDKDFTNEDDALAESTLKGLRVRRGPQSMGVTLKGLPGWPDVRMAFEYELIPPEGFVWP